jgi:TolB-like protein/DNA-binding winged helix-turn-helix (wHTH) protein/Tfp pilus assembly protein PilF
MVGPDSQQSSSKHQPSRLRLDDLVVDLDRRSVRRGAEVLDVTDRSLRLLESLIRYAPEPVSKDRLIAEVWDDAVVSDETLAQRVRLLRQCLGDDSRNPRYIASVRGRGYRLVAPLGDADAAPITRRPGILGFIAAVAILVGFAWAWRSTIAPEPNVDGPTAGTLAVLPFTDMSAGQDHQFFADGMHEELLSRLAMIDGLAVISRTSVERYRRTEASLPDIAEQLGASAVIEGSVRVDNNRLRVTVQLIDASSDEHIWAANFDRQMSVQDIFGLQTDVAGRIAEALKLEYSNALNGRGQLPTNNVEAYNLYLLGRYHTFKQTRRDLEDAVAYLEQAVEIDPDFAEAYATLGWAYSFLGSGYGARLPNEMYPKAREAALRAIALDAGLSDARTLYADILAWYDWDFAAAEREYKKTIALDPLNVLGYALFLSTQERHDEAIVLIEKRLAADPNDPYVRINAGWRYLNAGQTSKAIAAAMAAADHADGIPLLGWSRLAQNDTVGAVELFEAAMESRGRTSLNASNLAVAYFRDGRPADARRLLDELEAFAADNYVSPGLLAAVYFSANDADRGFAMLEKAFQERGRDMIFLRVTEILRGYRHDPRYLALLERVGLQKHLTPQGSTE